VGEKEKKKTDAAAENASRSQAGKGEWDGGDKGAECREVKPASVRQKGN